MDTLIKTAPEENLPALPELEDRFFLFCDLSNTKTRKTYREALERFVRWCQGEQITPIQATRADLINFREWMRSAGLASSTINLTLTVIHQFYGWISEETGRPDVSKGIRHLKTSAGYKRDALTPEQVLAVLGVIERETITGKRDRSLIITMVTTGIRVSEAAAARICDLDPVKSRLYLLGKGRDDRSEWVKMPQDALDAVNVYLDVRAPENALEPIFASRKGGKPLKSSSIGAIIKHYYRLAGLDSERLTAHSLRHTAATLARQSGESTENVQRMLRHKSIVTTQMYDHAIERETISPEESAARMIFNR